jgi:hypothetical protein
MKFTIYYEKPLEQRRPDLLVTARETPETVKRSDFSKITELEAEDLEVVFRRMNVVDGSDIELPQKLKCRSLSVGDVVEDSTGAPHYCASIGWVPVTWGAE